MNFATWEKLYAAELQDMSPTEKQRMFHISEQVAEKMNTLTNDYVFAGSQAVVAKLDRAKLLEHLGNEIRFYRELGPVFNDRRVELEALRREVELGKFDGMEE